MTKTANFRMIHLSDLHLTPNDSIPRSEVKLFGRNKGMNTFFRNLLEDERIRTADFIMITGDITDRGDQESWQVFWNLVTNAGLQKRVKVIPGNHDICCLGINPTPNSKARVGENRRKVKKGLLSCDQETEFPWAYQPHKDVVLFGLDSNNAGNLTGLSNAVGTIGFHQLEALARKIKKFRKIPVKIISLHHSPNIASKKTAAKRFQKGLPLWKVLTHQVPRADRRSLRLLALTHNVRLIIHGHLHYADDRRVNGIRIVGAPASTEPVSGPAKNLQYYEYVVYPTSHRVNVTLQSLHL